MLRMQREFNTGHQRTYDGYRAKPAPRASWGPTMPEQRYGKRAVNELRAMETYKKTTNCCQLCLLLSNNNVDPKNYKRNHRKLVSIRCW